MSGLPFQNFEHSYWPEDHDNDEASITTDDDDIAEGQVLRQIASAVQTTPSREVGLKIWQISECSTECHGRIFAGPPTLAIPTHCTGHVDSTAAAAGPGPYRTIHSHQTRLLRLAPGQRGEPISIGLITVDLLHTSGGFVASTQAWVTYEAISYCWGTAGADILISCGTSTLSVTRTVHDVLSSLRYHNKVRHLWIDAVCINQRDLAERSAQVRTMLSIFKKAARVIVHLGPHEQDVNEAMQAMSTHATMEATSQMKDLAADRISMILCESHTSQLERGLRKLFTRPWFRRVWVKQEVWAAETLVVMCSEVTINWNTLLSASAWFQQRPSIADETTQSLVEATAAFVRPTASERLKLTLRELPDTGAGGTTDIVSVLRRTAGSECSDPHDHIYGILGMSATNLQTSRQPHLVVDYKQTASESFADVVRYIVARDKSLQILQTQTKFGGRIDGQELPSWCPDWRTLTNESPSLDDLFYEEALQQWWTTGDTYNIWSRSPHMAQQQTLMLTGWQFARISSNSMASGRLHIDDMVHGLGNCSANPSEHPMISKISETILQAEIMFTLPSVVLRNDVLILVPGSRRALILRPLDDGSGAYSFVGCVTSRWTTQANGTLSASTKVAKLLLMSTVFAQISASRHTAHTWEVV